MVYQLKGERGRFRPKGDEPRWMRAITLTDTAWKKLAVIAEKKGCSRADLIEYGLLIDRDEIIQELTDFGDELLNDKSLTRGGKDRAVVKRTLQAIIAHLQTIPTTPPHTY